jgi:hypothetical protein
MSYFPYLFQQLLKVFTTAAMGGAMIAMQVVGDRFFSHFSKMFNFAATTSICFPSF